MKDIGRKIKQIREYKGLTQKELAKLSGVKYTTLTKLETGVIVDPKLSQITKLLAALEITFEQLESITVNT